MGITEILRRIWLFSANKIKSSESISKQQTQLIIAAHNCHIEVLYIKICNFKLCGAPTTSMLMYPLWFNAPFQTYPNFIINYILRWNATNFIGKKYERHGKPQLIKIASDKKSEQMFVSDFFINLFVTSKNEFSHSRI